MKNTTKAGIIMAAIIFLGSPALSHAASYAYVSTFGEVKEVTAGTWQAAMVSAVGKHSESGVCLMTTQSDRGMLGDDVAGY
ncbi:MAG: hypothetical protein NUV96_00700 [Candidatus Colwellbacteria bacterium]|nr:hypothetical protein [Candidatus Colwellbacteria bacterium]